MAKNIEGTVTELPDVISVNELLKQSFGRRVRGNYKSLRPLAFLDTDREYVDSPKLGTIILEKIFFGGDMVIGRFAKEDGSHLRLYIKGPFSIYVSRAKKYARLYEERFGREVLIEHHRERV